MGIKKRVQKKSFLKKDVEDIVPISKRVLNFCSRNAKEFLSIFSFLILVAASVFFLNIYRSSQEKKAIQLFAEAFKIYSKAVDQGNPSDYQMAITKFNNLVNKFPKTSIGKNSLFYIGNCYFWIKEYNSSEKYFNLFVDKSSKKDRSFRIFSFEGLGYSAEQNGKFTQAEEFFKKALKESSNNNSDESVLMNIARVYEEMKQNDKALEIYKKIIKDFPQSSNIGLVKGKISILKNLS